MSNGLGCVGIRGVLLSLTIPYFLLPGLITGSVMPIWGDLTKVILGSYRNLDKDFLKIAKGKMEKMPGKDEHETIVGVLCRSDLKETLASKILEKRKEFSETTCCKEEDSIAFQVVNQVGF